MKAIVIKTTGNLYTVRCDNGDTINCMLKGKYRTKGLQSSNPVAIGDMVTVEYSGNIGYIIDIDDRKNYLIRKPSNWSKQVHIIAANIDQCFLICTIKNPETTLEFIDRFLVSAQTFRIPVIIVFNKYDLYNEYDLDTLKQYTKIYSDINYKVINTSINNSNSINEVANLMQNKISLISGNSGVGKSTIINKLASKEITKTASISQYHNTGMHTTSYSEMYELPNKSYVIDTPGLKAFGVINIAKSELYHYFPEIFNYAVDCKFYNCLHTNEPDCNVKKAVESGYISLSRYNTYLKLFFDENEKYRQKIK